jgi:hypothetical protein
VKRHRSPLCPSSIPKNMASTRLSSCIEARH